jgi:nitrate reductase delta subunit
MVDAKQKEIYVRLGKLLDYPDDQLSAHTIECEQLLVSELPDASHQMRKFLDFVNVTPQGRMEEIYTGTFDVSPTCFIFAGYMLFGETFKRGEFLVQLQERYHQHNFSVGRELADHVAVIFRFIATLDDGEVLRREIVEDCLLPVLEKMISNFKVDTDRSNPYVHVLRAGIDALEHDLQYGSPRGKAILRAYKKEMAQ